MEWKIDNAHSVAEFSVRHMMVANTKGRFQKVDGTVSFDPENIAASSVEATIDVSSITTHDEKRDGHLLSPDFFDVATYPTLTFKSTGVEKVSGDNFTVKGDLTIRDVTRSVTLEVEYNGQGVNPWGVKVAGFTAKTSVSRKDFGLNWNVALETGGVLVGEKVNITLEIEAQAQVAAAV
jgi:polyisoprenoid-binding protein YceI